jgi:hypothetical protein
VRTPILSIDPLDPTIQTFKYSLSFEFPAWWNETSNTPNLDDFCLAFLNKTNDWWECVDSSELYFVAETVAKRDVSSPTPSYIVQASGTAVMPGSYAILGKY